jgi:serine/threonine protein kinase
VGFLAFIDRLIPEWALCSMCFIVMEHCTGGSLVHFIERMRTEGRKTTAAEAAVIGAQLVSGLSYCHERNIGHCDLKPHNVFIMADFIEVY